MADSLKALLDKAPEIIREAAQTPAGLGALAILVLGVVAAFLFRDGSPRTKLGALALLILAFVVLSTIAIYQANPTMIQIAGHVFDATTHEDIQSAKVTLDVPGLGANITDTEGRFYVRIPWSSLDAGGVVIAIEAPNYHPFRGRRQFARPTEAPLLPLPLKAQAGKTIPVAFVAKKPLPPPVTAKKLPASIMVTLEQIVLKDALDPSARVTKTVVVPTETGHPRGIHRTTRAKATADPGYQFVREYARGRSDFLVACQGQDNSCQFFAQPIACTLFQGDTQVECVSVTTSHALTLTYEFPMRRVIKVRDPVPDQEFLLMAGVTTPVTFRDTATKVRLSGRTASGQEVQVTLVPKSQSPDGAIACSDPVVIGNGQQQSDCRLDPGRL